MTVPTHKINILSPEGEKSAFVVTSQLLESTPPGVVSFTNSPILTWHLPTYNILRRHPPLTLGAEVQLCWLLSLTL